MRLERFWGVYERQTCVLITPLLILLGTSIIDVSKILVRVDDDEVRSANAGVGKVSTEAGVKSGENGIIVRVDGRRSRGRDEVDEVARVNGLSSQ